MNDEPRGHTIDGTPWEEPRPPHLPDTLTRLSPCLIAFLLLAAVEIFIGSKQVFYPGAELDPSRLLIIAADHSREVVAPLLGAALFWRHRDALRVLPLLVVGTALVATAELLRLAAEPLSEVFLRLTPPTDEWPFFIPLADAYRLFSTLLGAFGLVYIARGLVSARQRADRASFRWLAVALTAVSIALVIIGEGSVVTAARESTFPSGLVSDVLLGGSILVNLSTRLALSYLLLAALRGFLARERPRIGWLLVALGAGLLLAFRWVATISLVIPIAQPGGAVSFWLLLAATASGWLLLLAAFIAGLPSTNAADTELEVPATPGLPAARTPDFEAG